MSTRYARFVGLVWVLVLLAICVRVGVSPSRQSSYAKDYAPAGEHWLHGAEIYSHRRHFVYSPPVAAFFAVFAALPGTLGDILWRLASAGLLLSAAVAWLGSPLSSLGTRPAQRWKGPLRPTGVLLLLPLAIGNLNLGQMNVLVLVLLAGGVLMAERERWNVAAVLLAAAGFIKIYPLAIGGLLVLLWPRELGWRLALALAGWFAVSFALQRPGYVWTEYHQWFAVLGRDDRLDMDLYSTWRDFGYLLRACGVPLSNQVYRSIEAASGAALAWFLWLGQRRGHWPPGRLLGGVFCLGCAWMMLFGPATEAATYVVLALPVVGMLVAAWTVPAGPGHEPSALPSRIVFTAVYLILLLADVANSWFRGQTDHLYMRALQPVAALLFTVGVAWRLCCPLPGAPVGSMLPHANVHSENGGGDRRIG